MHPRSRTLAFLIGSAGMAFLLCGPAWAGEGVSDDFFDRVIHVDPKPKFSGTSGRIDASDAEYDTEIAVACEDNQSDFTLSCTADHLDAVKIKTDRAKLVQKGKDNPTQVRLQGIVGGIQTDVICSCEKATQFSQAIEKNRKMKLHCEMKRCDCLGDLTADDMQAVTQCLDRSKAVKLKLKDGLLDGKIQTKGIIATF